jgi:hypothetical protein
LCFGGGKIVSVFHIHKRELPFVQIDKQLVNDNRLSWKAKGIMLYLLSKPDNWNVYELDIANNSADKLCSVRSGIKELIQLGYITRTKQRDSKKKFAGYLYNVYEQPTKPVNITVMRFSDNGKSNASNNDITNSEIDFNEPVPYIFSGQGKQSVCRKMTEGETKEEYATKIDLYRKIYNGRKDVN